MVLWDLMFAQSKLVKEGKLSFCLSFFWLSFQATHYLVSKVFI